MTHKKLLALMNNTKLNLQKSETNLENVYTVFAHTFELCQGSLQKTEESVTTFHLGLPTVTPNFDPNFSVFLFCFYSIWQSMKHILVLFNILQAQTKEYFKVPVTVSLCQLLRYQRQYIWSLTRNYLQYLACLKLGLNTKFVLGLP